MKEVSWQIQAESNRKDKFIEKAEQTEKSLLQQSWRKSKQNEITAL